jgi:hypothetical protein
MPIVNAKRIEELSWYNHNVYELTSRIDGSESKVYIIEICDDDNLMIYQLTKNPKSKNYEDIIFEWETSWNERIKFIEN